MNDTGFVSKRFLREEVTRLQYRVKELEEKLCPAEEHDWKKVDRRCVTVCMDEEVFVTDLVCKRCGKRKTEREYC